MRVSSDGSRAWVEVAVSGSRFALSGRPDELVEWLGQARTLVASTMATPRAISAKLGVPKEDAMTTIHRLPAGTAVRWTADRHRVRSAVVVRYCGAESECTVISVDGVERHARPADLVAAQ
mgnify:FL=1